MLLVKGSIAFMALLVFGTAMASGMQQASSATKHENSFHWVASEAQQLGSEDRIKESKSLDSAERVALVRAIAAQLRSQTTNLEIHSERELQSVAADTRIRFVDLNDDGVPEVIAQSWGEKGGCGATGNCFFWVFAKSEYGYKLILGGDRWVYQVFTVEANVTNSYHDLILGTHDSASERTLQIYRFKNGKYRRCECYDADWAPMDANGLHELKNPLITPCRFSDSKVK